MKMIEDGQNQWRSIVRMSRSLDNLSLLSHRFQKFAFTVKTICLHDNDIIAFSNLSTLETIQKLQFSVKTIIVFDRFRVDAR